MKKHVNDYSVKNHNLLICGVGLGFFIHLALAMIMALITGKGSWFESGGLMFVSFVLGVIITVWHTFRRLKRAKKHMKLMDEAVASNLSGESMSQLREFDEVEAKKEKRVNVVKRIVLAIAIAVALLFIWLIFKEAGF